MRLLIIDYCARQDLVIHILWFILGFTRRSISWFEALRCCRCSSIIGQRCPFWYHGAISKQYFPTSPTSIANLSEVNHYSNRFVFKRIVVLLSHQENGRVGIIFFSRNTPLSVPCAQLSAERRKNEKTPFWGAV